MKESLANCDFTISFPLVAGLRSEAQRTYDDGSIAKPCVILAVICRRQVAPPPVLGTVRMSTEVLGEPIVNIVGKVKPRLFLRQ